MADWFRSSSRNRWSPQLIASGFVPSSHILKGRNGQLGTLADFVAHKNSVSTLGLLLLARRWYSSLESAQGKSGAFAVFQALVGIAPANFRVSLRSRSALAASPSVAVEYVDVEVRNSKLQPEVKFRHLCSDAHARGWPFEEVDVCQVVRGCGAANEELTVDLLRGVAVALEHHIAATHETSQDIVAKLVDSKAFNIDPDVKALTNKLGRSGFRTASLCKSLNLRVAGNAHREQTLERTKYWLATRRAMSTGTTWATSIDATRFSGKDWQCGPICNSSSQVYAWMAPVVGPRSV